MLTKDLLKVNLQKGFIHPQFIDMRDLQAQDLARRLLKIVCESKGKTQSQIEESLDQEVEAENVYYATGFQKLLLDQIEFSEIQEDSESLRWDLINAAQNLRQESYFKSKEEFQETFCSHYIKDFKSLSDSLYADLPEFRLMSEGLDWSESELLSRYNCSLVQSLLLLAPKVEVQVSFSSAGERRNLFRAIKFHRLVVGDIRFQDGVLFFSIDGPLSILVNTQAYGMRLANFFPRLIMNKTWNIEATVPYRKKTYKLLLSEKDALKSHYKEWGDYRPQEFVAFLNAFNKTSLEWQAEWCEELIELGGQEFCFPDLSFVHAQDGQKVHLELFHRWHRGELDKRIRILQRITNSQVIIGVCNSLIKKDNMALSPVQEEDFDEFGFIFREVPTPKAVNALLSRVYKGREKKV